MPVPSTASLPQTASIVSRYKFDEVSGNATDIVGSLTLTDNNTVASSADVPISGFALSRDFELANSEYFNRADDNAHDFAGSFTISLWIKPESQTGTHRLVTKMDQGSATNRNYLLQMVTTDAMSMSVWDSSDTETSLTTSNSQVGTGAWQHWVAVYEASTRLTLYKNSVQNAENTTSIPATLKNSTSGLNVGATSDGSTAFYDGLMQDLILWKGVALSDAEVLSLYNRYYDPEVFGLPVFFT